MDCQLVVVVVSGVCRGRCARCTMESRCKGFMRVIDMPGDVLCGGTIG